MRLCLRGKKKSLIYAWEHWRTMPSDTETYGYFCSDFFFSLLGRWALKVITVNNYSEAWFPSLQQTGNFSLPPTICFTRALSKCFKVLQTFRFSTLNENKMTRHVTFLLLARLFHLRTCHSAHMSLCHLEQILSLQAWDKLIHYFEIIVPGSYIMSFPNVFQVLFSLQLPWLSASVSLLVGDKLALKTLNAP